MLMGCKLSQHRSLEDVAGEELTNCDAGRRTEGKQKKKGRRSDQKTGKKTAQSQNKKKRKRDTNGEVDGTGGIVVGNKLATTHQDGVQSPPLSNGGLSRADVGRNGSSNGSVSGAASRAGSRSPITHDKLHKNFQERLITTQLSRNGQKLTDSQLDFFRALDEKIDQGKDYDSGLSL